MLIDQKDILKEKLSQIKIAKTLQERLSDCKKQLENLQMQQSLDYFLRFMKNEAKHDDEIAEILKNKDSDPAPYFDFKNTYFRSIEKEMLDLQVEIEALENNLKSQPNWQKIEENHHTITNLQNAHNNLENHPGTFRERMVASREENKRLLSNRKPPVKPKAKEPTKE